MAANADSIAVPICISFILVLCEHSGGLQYSAELKENHTLYPKHLYNY